MSEYTYTKSFIGLMADEKLYKLNIMQKAIRIYDDVVWGEYKERKEEKQHSTELFFESKEELYRSILDNLIEHDNISFKFTYDKKNINELLNKKYNPITMCLKTGFTDIDINRNYINTEEIDNYTYKEEKDKAFENHITSFYGHSYLNKEQVKLKQKMKVSEDVDSINLRLNLLNDFADEINDFNNYAKVYIQNLKNISVEVDFPISKYYDDLSEICNLSRRYYFRENKHINIKNMLMDYKNKEFIFDTKKYDNIFYIIKDLEKNYFNRPKDVKPLINDSDVVVFKYKLGIASSPKTLSLRKENYRSKYEFTSEAKDVMYELKDLFFNKNHNRYTEKKITTFQIKKDKTLIVCLYEVTEDEINNAEEYFNIDDYEEKIKHAIKEEYQEFQKDTQKVNIENIYYSKSDFGVSDYNNMIWEQNTTGFEFDEKDFNTHDETENLEIKIDNNGILYFMDYHKYWVEKNGSKQRNINFTKINSKIFDLKRETDNDNDLNYRASDYLYDRIKKSLKNYINKNNIKALSIGIVPSHERGKTSVGLKRMAIKMCEEMNFEYSNNLLYRHKTINKLSQGGERSISVHYNSIIVLGKPMYKTILLLDDITTSGNSLIACKNMLENKGYNVICMSIGKTVKEQVGIEEIPF